jgi:uncharacterized protein YdhG (YjbR/CyaY superfamily)
MPGPARDIDDYLKGVSPVQRLALQKLRKQILALLPDAEECISYSMPAFRARGHVVAGFLATRKGCSFFPFSGTTLDTLASLLSGYSRTKSGLHFDPERGLPVTLLRQLLKARQAEIAAYPAKKAKKAPASKSVAKKQASPKKAREKRQARPG